MFQRRGNQVETIFINLTELDGAHEVHIGNAAIAITQITPSENSRAASALPEPISRKQRLELNAGILIGQRPKLQAACGTSLGEIFASERRIRIAIDGPEKRFPNTPA